VVSKIFESFKQVIKSLIHNYCAWKKFNWLERTCFV